MMILHIGRIGHLNMGCSVTGRAKSAHDGDETQHHVIQPNVHVRYMHADKTNAFVSTAL